MSSADSKRDKYINEYYEKKKKYYSRIEKEKEAIRKDDKLTEKEKIEKQKNIKKKCIKCNNEGGTIFQSNKNELIAICGCQTQCNLNLNIKKTKYFNIRDEDININNKINKLKAIIIKIKLDLIYKYDNEEVLLVEFQKIKNELFETTKYLLNIRKNYLNIINNSETNEILQTLANEYNKVIKEIQELGTKFLEENNDSIIKTILEKYFGDLMPLVEKIRKSKYLYSGIIEEKKNPGLTTEKTIYELYQQPFTIAELYIPIL